MEISGTLHDAAGLREGDFAKPEEEVPGEIPKELHDNLDMWIFDTEADVHELEPAI